MRTSLKSKIAIIIVAALVVAIGAYMILNARSSYSYEDIAESIEVETAPNGDACVKALIAQNDMGTNIMLWELLEADEVNKIEYYSAVIYVTTSVKERYFGESELLPICLVNEDGFGFHTIFFDGKYDENGMPIPIDQSPAIYEKDEVEYKQYVTEVYYAEFEQNGLNRTLKNTPKLIWSKD